MQLGDKCPNDIAPWSTLAAILATAFIEMGAQAAIAARWRIGRNWRYAKGGALRGIEAGADIDVPAMPAPAQDRQLLHDGRQHIGLLVQLAPTAQRLALLGHYWVLQARLARAGGSSGAPALRAMTDACLATLGVARLAQRRASAQTAAGPTARHSPWQP